MKRRFPTTLSLLALVLIATSCDPTPSPESNPNPPASGGVDIPFPSLDNLDPQVRETLTRVRAGMPEALSRAESDAARAEVYGMAGREYQATSFLESAESCYRKARELEPRSFSWTYLLAVVLSGRDRVDESVELYREALEQQPDYLPGHIGLGHVLRRAGRLDEAAGSFQAAMDLRADVPAALGGLGRVRVQQGAHAEAVRLLTRALELDPRASALHYPLGLAYRSLGQLEKAAEHLQQRGMAETVVPDPLLDEVKALESGVRLLVNRGNDYFEQGFYEESLKRYRAAVDSDPANAQALCNIASALVRLGRPEEAGPYLRRALEVDPGHAVANFNLGTLEAASGRHLSAVASYERALERDPKLLDARFNLANARRHMGDFEGALSNYRGILREAPAHRHAWLGVLLALVKLGRFEEADRESRAAVEAIPGDVALENVRARLLATNPVDSCRNGAEALRIALELRAHATTLDAVEATAMALAELGRFEEAVGLQNRAIEAASQAGRADLVDSLTDNLREYQAKRPCRRPWPPDGAILSPGGD